MADDTQTQQPIPPNPPATSQDEPLGEGGLSALKAERERAKEAERLAKTLKAQLEAFSGIDPEKAKQAMEIAAKQAEWEEQQAKLKADMEAEFQRKYEPQLQQQRELAAQAQQQLEETRIDIALQQEFSALEGFAENYKYARLDMRGRVRLEDGKIVVLEEDGKTPAYVPDQGTSRPMTVSELILKLQETVPGFARNFRGKDRPGFGPLSNGTPLPADASPSDLWAAAEAARSKRFGR